MDELRVLAFGSVKEDGDDPAIDGEKKNTHKKPSIRCYC